VNVSSNLSSWATNTGWLQASNNPVMSYTITNAGVGSKFFRVEVKP